MRVALLCLACVVALSPVGAQPVVERVTRQDGLPSDYVLATHQDRWGFIWFGTDAGAVRWDGRRARTFSTDDGLPHPYVTGFAETPDGTLWAATNGGLARQRPTGTWEAVDSPLGQGPIGHIGADADGQLVIANGAMFARREGGLWRSARSDLRLGHAPVIDVGGGQLLASGFREPAALLFTPEAGPIGSPEASGGFRTKRLPIEGLAMEPGRGVITLYPDRASGDPDRLLGVVNQRYDDWVIRLRLDAHRQRLVVTGVARIPDGVGALAWHGGTPYATGTGGMYSLDTETGEQGPLLLTQHVRSALTDREGGLWMGTFGEGAARLMSTHLTALSEVPSRRVALVGGEAWAFGGAGATWVDLDRRRPLARSFQRSGPRSVVATPDGRFRVSGQASLFGALDTPGIFRSLRGRNAFPNAVEDGNWVSGSAETADSLWLGSYGSALRRFLKASEASGGLTEIDTVGVADGLPTEAVEDVVRTSAGTWAVTRRGLGLVSGGRARAMTATHGLPSSAVFAIYEDARGHHWAGTDRGVARLDLGLWRAETVGETGGRPAVAFFERPSEPGAVYAVTTRGLWRIEGGEIEPVDAFPLVRDGQTIIEHAVLHAPSDRLVLATSAGVTIADLSAMQSGTPSVAPAVALVSATVDDAPADLIGSPRAARLTTLAPGRHRVVIEVAALRFGGAAEVEWREPGGVWRVAPEARVVLPDVGAGSHAIEVRAVAPDGTASPEATLAFRVAPRWWERSAVRVLLGLLALGSLIAGVRVLSQRRLRTRVQELETAERVRAERERISRDLHDHVGAEVAAILAEAEIARLEAATEGRDATSLRGVEQRARRTMSSLREAIWALGQGALTSEALALRLGEFARGQARRAGIAVEAIARGDTDRPLAPMTALALYRIGQEAVRNAIRHSGGLHLRILIEVRGARVAVTVRDDGSFRPPGEPSGDGGAVGGYGIGNMRARAEALGGTFAITNGDGTTVRAEIPLERA